MLHLLAFCSPSPHYSENIQSFSAEGLRYAIEKMDGTKKKHFVELRKKALVDGQGKEKEVEEEVVVAASSGKRKSALVEEEGDEDPRPAKKPRKK